MLYYSYFFAIATVYDPVRLSLLSAGAGDLQRTEPLQYEVRVINVEVPVRVFRGDTFVDGLTLKDFEVYEDGVLQNLEAVYLVKNTSVQRKEEVKPFAPITPITTRYFYLFFVVYEYNPKIREAVSFFISNVLQPDDHLFVVTPKTSYEMKKETLANIPKEKIADKLTGIIKKDILVGEGAYRSVLRDLKRMAGGPVKGIEDQMREPGERDFGSTEEFLMQYRADLERLQNLRTLDEQKLNDLASFLKAKKGHKEVYLFYQREFIPQIDTKTLFIWEQNPVLKPFIEELFGLYQKTARIDMDRLKKTYADSSIAIHFLYLTTLPDDIAREQMQERNWDIYETFGNLAKATGGLAVSSANIASLMKKASSASENYYLLYYSPKDKSANGKFRQIVVKVKSGGYRVSHLAGYYAK
jgi:hypothetical protein